MSIVSHLQDGIHNLYTTVQTNKLLAVYAEVERLRTLLVEAHSILIDAEIDIDPEMESETFRLVTDMRAKISKEIWK